MHAEVDVALVVAGIGGGGPAIATLVKEFKGSDPSKILLRVGVSSVRLAIHPAT